MELYRKFRGCALFLPRAGEFIVVREQFFAMDAALIFKNINENIKQLGIDDIRELIRPLMKGVSVQAPIIRAGRFLYRARKIDTSFNKDRKIFLKNLKNPPPDKSKLGRVNRDGQSVFYCSGSKEPVLFELPNLSNGDEIILSFWKTTEDMIVNNLGYTEYIFNRMGAKRVLPPWSNIKIDDTKQKIIFSENSIPAEVRESIMSQDQNRMFRELMSEVFMHQVNDSDRHHYKLTIALAELHLGEIKDYSKQFAGIIYPSVRMFANGDNFALKPEIVNGNIEFKKAAHIRINDMSENSFSITNIDAAIELDKDGSLKWLGHLPHWVLNKPFQEAKFTVTEGQDEYGDYERNKDGLPCHWVAVDGKTGEIINRC